MSLNTMPRNSIVEILLDLLKHLERTLEKHLSGYAEVMQRSGFGRQSLLKPNDGVRPKTIGHRTFLRGCVAKNRGLPGNRGVEISQDSRNKKDYGSYNPGKVSPELFSKASCYSGDLCHA